MPADRVYSVHVTKPDTVGAVEVIFPTEPEARAYALDRSQDDRVLAASVTSFSLGELGTRRPVCWYRDGAEQPRKFDRLDLYGC